MSQLGVFLDMDGVVVNWVRGICAAHNRPNPYLEPHAQGVWDVWSLWNMTIDDFWAPCSSEFWRGLAKTEEADALVGIATAASGVVCGTALPVRVITMPASHGLEGCIEGKLGWLDEHYPTLSHEVIFERDKWKYAAAQPGSLLIDDNEKNCAKWIQSGGYAVLVPRPWNCRWRVAHDVVDVVREGVKAWIWKQRGGVAC